MDRKKFFKEFNGNPGITPEDLAEAKPSKRVPQEYLDFLRTLNGGNGFIGGEYIELFKAEELNQINEKYAAHEHVPGIYLIGSNGSGEALAIDSREGSNAYILISFLFEESSIIKLGEDLEEFFERIYSHGFFE
ncbi:MAG: SMI1/KNR4 family protein [Saprospiraceae bacterium]|nr:SMI1/KNR4 family protein [Saprospiraceae bacterium]